VRQQHCNHFKSRSNPRKQNFKLDQNTTARQKTERKKMIDGRIQLGGFSKDRDDLKPAS
jgi:hypothetical protein